MSHFVLKLMKSQQWKKLISKKPPSYIRIYLLETFTLQ